MATRALTPAQLRATVKAVMKHGSVPAAALALDISHSTMRHRVREAIRRKVVKAENIPRGVGGATPTTGSGGGAAGVTRKILGGPPGQHAEVRTTPTGEMEATSEGNRIRSVEALMEHLHLRGDQWRHGAPKIKYYEGYYKDNDGNAHVVPMWAISVRLHAKRPWDPDVVRDEMIESMKKWAPKYQSPPPPPPGRCAATLPPAGRGSKEWEGKASEGKASGNRHRASGKSGNGKQRSRTGAGCQVPGATSAKRDVLLEIAVPDLHIGKLAWKPETGESYDTGRAVGVYESVTAALVDQALRGWGDRIERILLPVGNDLLHVDNAENTTTGGTRMDSDTRYQKSFRMAAEMLVRSIEGLSAIAPVEVIVVPGNHDRQRAFYIGEVLTAWFSKHPRVSVDNAPTLRKYYRWGTSLIMFTHGCDEKGRELAQIMAHERPRDWSDTTTREAHLGHWHKRREVRHTAGDTHLGFAERVLPSLSGTDAWHHQKGYISGPKEATALLYDRAEGYIGQFARRAPGGTYG